MLQQKAVQFQSQEGKKVICIMWQKAVQFQSKQAIYVTAKSHTTSK